MQYGVRIQVWSICKLNILAHCGGVMPMQEWTLKHPLRRLCGTLDKAFETQFMLTVQKEPCKSTNIFGVRACGLQRVYKQWCTLPCKIREQQIQVCDTENYNRYIITTPSRQKPCQLNQWLNIGICLDLPAMHCLCPSWFCLGFPPLNVNSALSWISAPGNFW